MAKGKVPSTKTNSTARIAARRAELPPEMKVRVAGGKAMVSRKPSSLNRLPIALRAHCTR